MSSCEDENIPLAEKAKQPDELPEEIVLRKDYSCYCKVCECILNRVKDAIQHTKGKRHKKSLMMKNAKENRSLKRLMSGDDDDNAKKIKTEEKKAKEMLSKVFDETFHGGVVALADNYYCKVCRCMIGNNRKNVSQHKEGKSHKMALEKFKSSLLAGTIQDDIPIEDPEIPFGDRFIEKTKNAKRKTVYYCKLCDLRTKEHDVMEAHVKDEKHLENVHIQEEKEIMAVGKDYYGYQSNYYGQGSLDGSAYAGERSSESRENGYGRWNPYASQGYHSTAELFIHSKKEPPFHSDYRNEIAKNAWDPSYEKLGADQLTETALAYNGPLMMPQQTQVPCLPAVQQSSIPFLPPSQQLGVTFMPTQPSTIPFIAPSQLPTVPLSNSQQTLFPVSSHIQSQQNALQTPVQAQEPTEKSQTSVAASGDLPGFITSESDAEIVIGVIESLLQTYLKYRLQALPGSLMKLLRKTSKGEESATSVNKDVIDKITKQIFRDTQNHKMQCLLPEEKSFSPTVSYSDNKPSKGFKKASSPLDQAAPKTPASNARHSSYNSFEIDDSYDRRSYIEDQLKRAFTRGVARRQNEDGTSKKPKHTESSIVDFIKQCRERAEKNIESHSSDLFRDLGSSSLEKVMRNIGQSSAGNFYRHYSYTNNEKYRGLSSEPTINDLPSQYNKKDDRSPIVRNSESDNTDFVDRYNKRFGTNSRLPLPEMSRQTENFRNEGRTSKGLHQHTQSVLDLFKKYRGSGTYF